MAKAATAKRENGFTVYPDSDTLAAIDKLATSEDRPRSNMAVVLIKKGLESVRKAAK